MSTLAERVTEAVEKSGADVKAIAQACGISEQAVYQWMTGETKKISGENLVELAEITGFEPRWIAKETGPRRRRYAQTNQQEHILKVMQEHPEVYSNTIVKIADTVVEQLPDQDNGGKKNAA